MNAVTLEPDDSLKESITMSFRHTFACIQIMSTNYVRGQKLLLWKLKTGSTKTTKK